MGDQDRQHIVTNADLRRGARSPNPGAVRLAEHMGGQHAGAARPCSQFGLMVSHWKGRLPAIAPDRAALSMDR
jgi:hypothetical protein